MKNDITLKYRSVLRPDPLWPEQALFGGYTYLALADGVWCSRIYEYAVACIMSNKDPTLIESARKELQNPGVLYHPTPLQNSNYAKMTVTLHRAGCFAIQGYSQAAEEFLSQMYYTNIYSDANYRVPHLTQITTEEVCQLSSRMLVLMHQSSQQLKSNILNWGNIIVYNGESFSDDNCTLQLGGTSYGLTTNS